jgi:hypothetical protein
MADELDSKLALLGAATEGLGPKPGFGERVLAAVNAESVPTFGAGVVRFGRAMLAIAAVSAVLGVTFGFMSEHAADEALATTFGMEELDW